MKAVTTKKEVTEGKLLTFVLGDKEYCTEFQRVKEIIGLMDITRVPQAPGYMKGIINLRGKIIPVIDLRLKFSIREEMHTQEACIIVAEVNNTLIGIIVDSVSEELDIKSEEIEEAPGFGQRIDTDLIMGMDKTKVGVIIHLDIESVLSSEELEMVEQLAKEQLF